MTTPELQQLLDKGIRAARQGLDEHAEAILFQVVAAAPENELAWLWLAKVAAEPDDKAASLEKAIALNPNNRWAADQLAALRGDIAPSAQLNARSSVRVDQLKCPNCAGAVAIQLDASKTVTCQYCDSIVDLSTEQRQAIVGKKSGCQPHMPIPLGAEATFDDTRYQVIGWLNFKAQDDEDIWYWDEWLLASPTGEYRWLCWDDDEGFSLYRSLPIREPIMPDRKTIPLPEGRAKIIEREEAEIVGLDGELTWRATIGDRFTTIDARRGKQGYSVEISDNEIELFEREVLAQAVVAEAFNNDKLLQRPQKRTGKRGSPERTRSARLRSQRARVANARRRHDDHTDIPPPLSSETVATLVAVLIVILFLLYLSWNMGLWRSTSHRGYHGVSIRGASFSGGGYRAGK